MKLSKATYNKLLKRIGTTVESGRAEALSLLNQQMLFTYWQIGQHIVEYEQQGNIRAEYGGTLLHDLAKDLSIRLGKGFSRSNIYMMRQFFILFPKFQTSGKSSLQKRLTSGKISVQKIQTSGKLSWSHYCELISVSDNKARSFYKKQCEKENWSVRELKRQINASLFERLAFSKDKKGILQLARNGHQINDAQDLIKDPYFFEFLNLPLSKKLTERNLEKKLIDNLQYFLLELGKGFSFVARQYKVTVDNDHHFIDLVFYHRILKCFVLIDLKISRVKHKDIGQMNLYLNYFKEEESSTGDNEPIGIIIGADKNDLLIKYATGGLSNKIFVSKYKLYLPDNKMIERSLKAALKEV
ncbi:MAG TPA: PDDEXK nuclease domain-containing protein [Flavipsychrobacter sp.]|nr:PDDEXK nuclease domain-containing protein [Flavipsychrobacter sp.]